MEIQMRRVMTFDNSLDDMFRRAEPESITAKNIRALLEEEGADGKPLVLIIAGVREGDRPGRYILREVRRVITYQSKTFLDAERERYAKEEEERKQAARSARLNQIKARLRAGGKADDKDFDKRYDQQSKEQAEAVEAEIEQAALAILEKEDKLIKGQE